MIDLRGYQGESITQLREGVRQGHKRQILSAPTGSGKTHVGMFLVHEAANKFSKTAFICDRVALIDQTSALFDAHGISHGVIQAGHWRWRPYERVQVCSAQTLARRGIAEDLKLIIVDEAHTCFKTTTEFILRHPDIVTVGLTATPFTKGLGKIYTRVVNVSTTDELVASNHLAPLKIFACVPIDMKGARLKFDGEWADDEIKKRSMVIVGDVVDEWTKKTQEHFGRPVKTILFSAGVDHGEALCEKFQSLGHNFQQVSYKDGNDDRRRALIEEFRKPDSEIIGLVSVEALAKGFDVPDILCGVSCKPYRKSLSGHIQQLGRVMRSFPGKDFALWLDHSGNALRFLADTQEFFANGIHELDDGKHDAKVHEDPDEKEKREIVCGNCHSVMTAAMTHCPCCGWERSRRAGPEHVAGEMVEIGLKSKADFKHAYLQDKEHVWKQICHFSIERKHGDLVAAERFAKAQYQNLYGTWPRHAMRNIEPVPPCQELKGKIMSNLIAYFHRRKAT